MLIGYARVSTEEQDTALQRDALSAAGCDRLFEETASGARIDRVQLQAAIEFARNGDTIVVWKLDRLARSLSQLIQTVEGLAERGIGISSLTETIDSSSAGGKLIFHIFGALAEFERAVIRERTREGLLAARKRGRVGGRPSALSEKDMAIARTLLADTSIPVAEIIRRLGVSPATFYRHLPGGRTAPLTQDRRPAKA
jgi:DNA invertase Pin-like site-specific DNA recombinase